MIRPFEKIDARRIKSNEFSRPNDMDFVFDDPDFCKFTLVDDDSNVLAIICFRAYWEKNYLAFFLISEEIQPIYARALKNFIYDAIYDLQAERVQTDSVDCDLLNKWHMFLGFTHEGNRAKMLYGKDYNSWGLLKGRNF